MKRGLAALAWLLIVWTAAPAQAERLDGSRWRMRPETTLGRLWFWNRDTINFTAGQFSTAKGLKKGIQPVPYACAVEDGKNVWRAEQMSKKGTKISWTGAVDGDAMSGVNALSRPDGRVRVFGWQARKEPAPRAAPAKSP